MKVIQKSENNYSTSQSVDDSKNIPNPTLGTIRMVEEALSEMGEYPSKNKLWRQLPRQVQYPIFKEILKYLEESNKIIIDDNGAVIWVFADEQTIKELREKSRKLI